MLLSLLTRKQKSLWIVFETEMTLGRRPNEFKNWRCGQHVFVSLKQKGKILKAFSLKNQDSVSKL